MKRRKARGSGGAAARFAVTSALTALVLLVGVVLFAPAARATNTEDASSSERIELTAEVIDELLAAGDYEEGVVLATVSDAFAWPQARSRSASAQVENLFTYEQEAKPFSLLNALGLNGDDEEAAEEPARIVKIERAGATTRELLEKLATMDGVLDAQPNYVTAIADPAAGAEGGTEPSSATATAKATAQIAAGASASDDEANDAGALANDPLASLQYQLKDRGTGEDETPGGTNIQKLWEKLGFTSSKDVPEGQQRVIAVIDTGVDVTNPDLAGVMWTGGKRVDPAGSEYGYNFGDGYEPDDMVDDDGHGTHVAGIIAAELGNNEGGSGMAPNARIMALPVLAGEHSVSIEGALRAYGYVYKACQQGVDVLAINDSWGGMGPNGPTLLRLLDKLYRTFGTISVFASANDAVDNDARLTSYSSYDSDGIVAVNASDEQGAMAYFSNYGAATTDIAAPGYEILSTSAFNGYPPASDAIDRADLRASFADESRWLQFNVAADDEISHAEVKDGELVWTVGGTAAESVGKTIALESTPVNITELLGKNVTVEALSSLLIMSHTNNSVPTGLGWNMVVSVRATDGEWLDISHGGIGIAEGSSSSINMATFDSSAIDWGHFQIRMERTVREPMYAGKGFAFCFDTFALAGNVGLPYEYMSGTSMAAPTVTGALAAVSAAYPNDSAQELIARVMGAAHREDELAGTSVTGGLLDLDPARLDNPDPVVLDVEQDAQDPCLLIISGGFFGKDAGSVSVANTLRAEGAQALEVVSWSDGQIVVRISQDANLDAALRYIVVSAAGGATGSRKVALDATGDASQVARDLPLPAWGEQLGASVAEAGEWRMASAAGKLFATGRCTDPSDPDMEAVLTYDPATGKWSTVQAILDAELKICADEELGESFKAGTLLMASEGDTLYLIDTSLAALITYDVATDTATYEPLDVDESELEAYVQAMTIEIGGKPYGASLEMGQMRLAQGTLYITGLLAADPYGAIKGSSTVLSIDPATGKLTLATSLPTELFCQAVEAPEGAPIVVGGASYSESGMATFALSRDAYRLVNGTWKKIASLPETVQTDQDPVTASAVLPAGSRIALADGSARTLAHDSMAITFVNTGDKGPDTFVYDADANEWLGLKVRMSLTHVSYAAATYLDGHLYALGYAINGGDVASSYMVVKGMDIAKANEPATANATLSIMHTTDTHGYYKSDGYNKAIGYETLAALAQEVSPNLLVDAGDTFHGQSFATVSEGATTLELMNAVGYDAMTIGNHDWSYGAGRIAQLAKDSSSMAVLAANVKTADGDPVAGTSVTKTVTTPEGQRLRVAILGVYDEALGDTIAAANREGAVIENAAATANDLAAIARKEGANVVLVLTHSTDPQSFAAKLTGVDAVIAGHEHQLIDKTVTAADGRAVPVVEAGSHFKNIGLLTLSLTQGEDGAWTVATHTEKTWSQGDLEAKDADIEALIGKLEDANSQVLDEVLGTASAEYPYSWEAVRSGQTGIGHVVTTAYLQATGADVALENAGGIRAGISAGQVTAGQVLAVSPYGNTLDVYRMTGADLLALLERSVMLQDACNTAWAQQKDAADAGMSESDIYEAYPFPSDSGSVLAMGGITLKVDLSRPQGERILSATIDGKAVDASATYTVAMNSYIPQLTDTYPELARATKVSEHGTCEQALRALVAAEGWEGLVAQAGDVTFANGETDQPQKPAEKPEDKKPSKDTGDGGTAQKPATKKIPRTGDDAAFTVAASAGAGFALVAGGLAMRRRRAAR